MKTNGVTTRISLGLSALLLFAGLLSPRVIAAEPNTTIHVRLDTSKANPRNVEEQTQQSIVRDYGNAWQDLERALESNRVDALADNFTGIARDHWAATVREQAKAGISRRFVDRGHQLQVVFYSLEGSAMELKDTAQFEVQYLDGGKVVHSEQVTGHYIVLMTPSENSWKVRVLQEAPSGPPQQAAELRVFGRGDDSK